MKTCLVIAILNSLISAGCCIIFGFSLMFTYSGVAGAMVILLGTSTWIALAIVFNYVRERLDDDRSEYLNDKLSETIGTPWEHDEEHTTKK
jgi:hypothetical protein